MEIGWDAKSGVNLCAGTVEDLLIGIQRFARPASRGFGEVGMLDGILFGSAGGIAGNGHSQGKGISQLRLQLGVRSVTAATVAAAGIGHRSTPWITSFDA
jgi:hypothetical protein